MTLTSGNLLVPLSLLRGELQDQVSQTKLTDYPMLQAIAKQDAYQTSIQWPVNLGGAGGYGRSTSENPTTNNQEANEQASLPIGDRILAHSFTVRQNDVVQASKIAPQAVRNIYRTHVAAGIDYIFTQLNRLCYEGTGSNGDHGIIGLNKAAYNFVDASPDTDIYAGIDGVAYPGWTSVYNTAGSNRALTSDLLFDVEAAMATKGSRFDVLFMNPYLVNKYKKVFEARLAVDQVNGTADLGFTDVSFSGRPIVRDPRAPLNKIYMVRSSHVKLHTFSLAPVNNLVGMGTMSEVEKVQGINLLVAQMPITNPHAITYEISCQPQLQVFERRSVAILDAITQ